MNSLNKLPSVCFHPDKSHLLAYEMYIYCYIL